MRRLFSLHTMVGTLAIAGMAGLTVLFFSSGNLSFAQEKSAETVQEDNEVSVDELLQQAQQSMRQEEYQEAAALFQKVVDQDASIGIAWQQLGFCLHSAGDLDAAIPAHKKAATFDQYKPVSLYNLGCAYALKKDADKAFDYLNQAAAAGFDQVSHIEGDSDLDGIRDDARFVKFMAVVQGEDQPAAKDEKKKSSSSNTLAGTWKVESGSRMGNKSSEESLPPAITIDDKVIRIPTPDGQEFVMSYKIDDSKKPIAIDMAIEEGPAPDAKALGIIKMDGDKVTLCYDPTGQTRPDEFASTEDDGFHLFVMKKTKAVFDASKLVGDWVYISGSRSGEEVEKDHLAGQTVKITKDEITIPAGPDMNFVMSYEIDATKSPMALNMKIKEGPAPEGSEAVGIIKMEGDKIWLCYDAMGGKRPEKFETTEENGYFLFNLKKVVID